MAKKRVRRPWSDEEKRSICLQTLAPGVSVAQVARRYAMNANLILTWLKDPHFRPGEQETEELVFLPIEISTEPEATLFIASRSIPVQAAETADTPEPEVGEQKNKPKRKPLPDHLERKEQVLTPGDNRSKCGGDLKTLGEDVTEELEYVPSRFIVNRPVYCKQDCSPSHGLRLL